MWPWTPNTMGSTTKLNTKSRCSAVKFRFLFAIRRSNSFQSTIYWFSSQKQTSHDPSPKKKKLSDHEFVAAATRSTQYIPTLLPRQSPQGASQSWTSKSSLVAVSPAEVIALVRSPSLHLQLPSTSLVSFHSALVSSIFWHYFRFRFA